MCPFTVFMALYVEESLLIEPFGGKSSGRYATRLKCGDGKTTGQGEFPVTNFNVYAGGGGTAYCNNRNPSL